MLVRKFILCVMHNFVAHVLKRYASVVFDSNIESVCLCVIEKGGRENMYCYPLRPFKCV